MTPSPATAPFEAGQGGYTRGPWEIHNQSDWSVDTDGSNTYSHIGPVGSDPVCIAIVADYNADDDALLDANARLIATAPELLEALEQLLDGCDQFAAQYAYDDDGKRRADAARAAIAKARGGAA